MNGPYAGFPSPALIKEEAPKVVQFWRALDPKLPPPELATLACLDLAGDGVAQVGSFQIQVLLRAVPFELTSFKKVLTALCDAVTQAVMEQCDLQWDWQKNQVKEAAECWRASARGPVRAAVRAQSPTAIQARIIKET